MKILLAHAAAWLTLGLSLSCAIAADVIGTNAPPPFGEELSKQNDIYQSRGESVPPGYTLDRSLDVYADALGAGFAQALANLGPDDRWLDIGAGKAQALLDYLYPDGNLARRPQNVLSVSKSQVVAISIEDRRTDAWNLAAESTGSKLMKYFFGKRLRDYTLAELGQFQLITDVIGGFSYVNDLSLYMENTLGFLALNGNFHTVLQDVHFSNGSNQPYYKGAPFLTEIVKTNGEELTVCDWLKSISCVQVSCEARTGWKPPIESYHVRKVCNTVSVPALLPTRFQAGTPPERAFRRPN